MGGEKLRVWELSPGENQGAYERERRPFLLWSSNLNSHPLILKRGSHLTGYLARVQGQVGKKEIGSLRFCEIFVGRKVVQHNSGNRESFTWLNLPPPPPYTSNKYQKFVRLPLAVHTHKHVSTWQVWRRGYCPNPPLQFLWAYFFTCKLRVKTAAPWTFQRCCGGQRW